jgi:hypothetical protein
MRNASAFLCFAAGTPLRRPDYGRAVIRLPVRLSKVRSMLAPLAEGNCGGETFRETFCLATE